MERASSSKRITLMANVDAALGLGLVEHIIHIEQRMQPCQARRGGLGWDMLSQIPASSFFQWCVLHSRYNTFPQAHLAATQWNPSGD